MPRPAHRIVQRLRRAFTLVEILIVVVILGILAAIVVPQFSEATDSAQRTAAYDQLMKVRRAVDIYFWKEANQLPPVAAGIGSAAWGPLVSQDFLHAPPVNSYVGRAASKTVILGAGPDPAYQNTHGWIYNPATGEVWAGGFDINDEPLPRP